MVTGTPGVGKTTVSLNLATKLNAHYIDITDLVKTKKLVTSVDKKRKTLIADTKKVSDHLQETLSNIEDTIILEGHYVIDVVTKEDVDIVFVLRRDPRELKTVLDKRGYTEKKIWENLAAEILDVCLCDALSVCNEDKVCEIDVSGKDENAVVEEILLLLKKKQDFYFGTIDWLRKLESTGQLEEFLRKF
ncbi:adenylate kinase family protein [Thermoproteota archaeon]